jgi:hypothetical protein
MEYNVIRKLQEIAGSYFVFLPKAWIRANDLKQSDLMIVTYGETVEIKPKRRVAS